MMETKVLMAIIAALAVLIAVPWAKFFALLGFG